ncbi:hypothetical protein T4B_7231 [Trichinella pseudospiralis]|uniref:Uncharacterized protein n=1 Tax=Trichinella pseudospiralis TaxID=6337 RepID=A0A0V1K7H4_TRIPS|nr:hypothetical protein T4A_4599 [Trichinella pseudospiralis]KRZ20329.1 hypothetical protein T4B_7231 [Trichinella pseudospiralis]KRZ43194.1 hypothetical protein T4C_11835 [Trichinella pseudospiralis]
MLHRNIVSSHYLSTFSLMLMSDIAQVATSVPPSINLIEHVKKPQALCQPASEVDKQKCAQLLHRF